MGSLKLKCMVDIQKESQPWVRSNLNTWLRFGGEVSHGPLKLKYMADIQKKGQLWSARTSIHG